MRLPAIATCLALAVSGAAPSERSEKKPNVVFIMIDDLGWMDLACQGNKRVETPNVDRLATQGMRFTDAYAAAPVCSPTRAAILTGQSPARLHMTTHLPGHFVPKDAEWLPAEMVQQLPLEQVTIAERLKATGYATAFMGKWHLASPGDLKKQGRRKEEFYPRAQGFDVNLGGCHYGGPPTFFDPYKIPTLENRKGGEYLPDRLADEAIDFMKANRKGPFMLFLWNYAVHWPMEAPEPLLKKYAGRKGPGLNDTRYGAMIEAMDASIGRVLAALDALELAADTLVVFTSDNGGFMGVADNRPLRLGKGFLYEGGIRVPLIVRWPGVVKPGALCRTPVVSTDFFPTLLETAGLKPAPGVPLDGESLMPLLRQEGGLKRDSIAFHFPNYAWHKDNRLGGAIREGDYKLILNYDDDSVELYNVVEDVGEKRDLSATMTDKAERLRKKLKAWLADSDAWMPTRRKP